MLQNVIIIAIIVLIIGSAAYYVYKAKKSGRKCIGCPDGSTCKGKCSCCNCCDEENAKAKKH